MPIVRLSNLETLRTDRTPYRSRIRPTLNLNADSDRFRDANRNIEGCHELMGSINHASGIGLSVLGTGELILFSAGNRTGSPGSKGG